QLNHGIGVCTVDTPKAQGASGFLSKAGEIKLGDVSIKSGNEYITVTVVAMDDQPLRSSGKILVQTGTTARLSGWTTKTAEYKGDGKPVLKAFEMEARGQPPGQIVNPDATRVVNTPKLKTATLLPPAGYAVKNLDAENAGGKLTIKLPANALYVV